MLRFVSRCGTHARMIPVQLQKGLMSGNMRSSEKYLRRYSQANPQQVTENNTTITDEIGLTPENPNLVASPTSKCIVGCTCATDATTVNWFYITEGDAQVCNCGYYFKLVKLDKTTDFVPEYSRIMYVDPKSVDPRLQPKETSFLRKMFSKFKKSPEAPASMGKISKENKSRS